MAKCANPNWRNQDRSKWVSPAKPFMIGTSSTTEKQKKQGGVKIAADPYVDTVEHRDTKKVVSKLSLPGPSAMSPLTKKSRAVSPAKELHSADTQQAPRFSAYSRSDAVWAKRVGSASSLRQQRHLIYAKNIRASDRMDGVDAFTKRKEITFEEEVVG